MSDSRNVKYEGLLTLARNGLYASDITDAGYRLTRLVAMLHHLPELFREL